jgi:uncharacterized membrane protein
MRTSGFTPRRECLTGVRFVMGSRDQIEIEWRISREVDGISGRRQMFDRWFVSLIDRVIAAVPRRWLLIANMMNSMVVVGALLAPLMRAAGLHGPGELLFSAYGALCNQTPSNSYFLLGYQLALDQRMLAIYGFGLLAGLAFAILRRSVRPLPWRLYFLLVLPIAVDGFTQLFGWRQSTWELRTLTGGLFGVATVWLAYPRLNIAWSSPRRRVDTPACESSPVCN